MQSHIEQRPKPLPGKCRGVFQFTATSKADTLWECSQDALRAALKQWDTPAGIAVENVEQMYCSLGPTSLRIQVPNCV